MLDSAAARRLSSASVAGLAVAATAASVLVPWATQALRPSVWEVVVPVALTAAAVGALHSFRWLVSWCLSGAAITWCVSGLAPQLPAWGEGVADRLGLFPAAFVVVVLLLLLAGRRRRSKGLLAVAALLVAMVAGGGLRFPALATLGVLLASGVAVSRPWRAIDAGRAVVAVGLVALDPRMPFAPANRGLAGEGVSLLLVLSAGMIAVSARQSVDDWDPERGHATAAEFGRRIGRALEIGAVEVWFPVDDRRVDLTGLPGEPSTSPRCIYDRSGALVAEIVGVAYIDPAVEGPLTNLLVATGRRAALRYESRRQAEALAASQLRLVTAADQEHSRIQRQLARGVLAELEAVERSLHSLREPGDLPRRLGEARDELARFATGLDPLAGRTLQQALETLTGLPHVTTDIAVTDDPRALVARTAWFVASEAVANAVKHAPGTTVRVTAASGPTMLTVRVSDQGPGGVPPGGLIGLRDRVRAVGGSLRVVSDASGTMLEVLLPLTNGGIPVVRSRAIPDPRGAATNLGSAT